MRIEQLRGLRLHSRRTRQPINQARVHLRYQHAHRYRDTLAIEPLTRSLAHSGIDPQQQLRHLHELHALTRSPTGLPPTHASLSFLATTRSLTRKKHQAKRQECGACVGGGGWLAIEKRRQRRTQAGSSQCRASTGLRGTLVDFPPFCIFAIFSRSVLRF